MGKHIKFRRPVWDDEKGWIDQARPSQKTQTNASGNYGKNYTTHREVRGALIMKRPSDGETCLVLVMNPETMDCYKFPGGGVESGEEDIDAMVREIEEETGISIRKDALTQLGEGLAGAKGYPLTLFYAHVPDEEFKNIKERGDEGEIIDLIPAKRICDPDFVKSFPNTDNPPLFWGLKESAELVAVRFGFKHSPTEEEILELI